MIKIEIKNRLTGKIIFEYSKENNTVAETIKEFIKQALSKGNGYADLRYADLSAADLRSADLRYADLRYADLSAADLRSADLRSANLSDADLRYADLSAANLRSANLSDADLSDADLRSADLSAANLSSANLDKRYISISRIGSQKRMTTYCFEDDIIWCGCFKGTLKEFEVRVKETHKDNARYLKEYIGFIKYLKALK